MRRSLPIRALVLAAAAPVYAQSSSDSCRASGGRFCDLPQYLHDLYAIAALLGAILAVVVIGTIVYFRKVKRTKLEP